jgi:hypothetical protein
MMKESAESRERDQSKPGARSQPVDEGTNPSEHGLCPDSVGHEAATVRDSEGGPRCAEQPEPERLAAQAEYADEPPVNNRGSTDDRTPEEIEHERILAIPRPLPPEPGPPLGVTHQAQDVGETYCTVPEYFRTVHRPR